MRNAPFEDAAARKIIVHVRIELVAAEIGEVLYVVVGDRARRGPERLADLELVEILREGMPVPFRLFGARHELMHDARQGRRRALKRRALHVMEHAARAAHLLATAGATGTTVDQVRRSEERR